MAISRLNLLRGMSEDSVKDCGSAGVRPGPVGGEKVERIGSVHCRNPRAFLSRARLLCPRKSPALKALLEFDPAADLSRESPALRRFRFSSRACSSHRKLKLSHKKELLSGATVRSCHLEHSVGTLLFPCIPTNPEQLTTRSALAFPLGPFESSFPVEAPGLAR